MRSGLTICKECGLEVTKQGLGSHLRLKHGIISRTSKKRPLEDAVKQRFYEDPFAAPFELAEFLLKLFKGDDKKLIKTIKEVKKRQELEAE